MSDYIVSARKYRPQTFDTLVGQFNIASTLKNAIKNDQLAQAFLFCGSRGVGKTSTARILAKTINCTNRSEIIEACGECESCKSFEEGRSLNIYELDAASNNGVDHIRALIDQVRIPPQIGNYKVYIIDEVHMLSTQAFNAFLKTLEEPPKYAIFILATTEKHKVIPTILSRCQIFDFNNIQINDIVEHLNKIATNEGIDAENEALHLIAQKADGALRDALSIFDQIVSFTGKTLTYQAVSKNLNVLDYEYYFKIVDYAIQENIADTLVLYNEIVQNGFDGQQFLIGLAEHYRNLLVIKDPRTIELLEVGETIKKRYQEQSGDDNLPTQHILRALGVISQADTQYKTSKNQRLLVELTLMQLCSIKNELVKKKRLTDPVQIIPFKGQKESPQTKTTSSSQATNKKSSKNLSESINLKEAKKLSAPTGQLNNKYLSIEELSKATVEKQATTEDVPELNTARDPFTYDQLKMAWRQFAQKAKKENLHTLFIAMNSEEPKLSNETSIEFTVSNQVQLETLQRCRTDIVNFLRKKLNNGAIQLTTKEGTVSTSQKVFTGKDKFEKMAKQNPLLKELRQRFKLDIDI